MLIALGFGLFLSAIGVFVRDIQNFVPTAVMVLMFGSAVFYPLAFVPDWIRACSVESIGGPDRKCTQDAGVGHVA